MKSKYQTILDYLTGTTYILEFKKSCQHGTIVIYHYKSTKDNADRLQFSEEYLKELIERGIIEWI